MSLYAPTINYEKFFCREIFRSYRCLRGSFSSVKSHYRLLNRSIVDLHPREGSVRDKRMRDVIKVASCAFFVHVLRMYYTFCNYSFETSSRCSTLMLV